MILTLFIVIIIISLVLIILGLTKPTESAQALVGFFLLFLMSLVIINSTLEYETGSIVNSTYTYDGAEVTKTDQVITYTYDYFDDTTSHRVGYYLALAASAGLLGVIYGLRRTKYNEDV